MAHRIVLFCCFLLAAALVSAQSDSIFPPLRIGEWRQHLPWQRAFYVTQSDSKVYFATDWAVVEIDKTERSPRFISKVEGLSDVGVRLIRYNAATQTLVVIYTNSNIDLYKATDGSVINLPFIRKNVNISGDKNIYNVAFDGKFAYLACGFGIMKLNLERGEVVYTVFTGLPVHAVGVYKNTVYAGTGDGLYRLSADDANPADFSRWQALGAAEGFPAGQSIRAMTLWNNALYLGIEKTLYRYDGATLSVEAINPDRFVQYLTSEGPGMVVAWKKDFNGSVDYYETNGARNEISFRCDFGKPLYAVEDGSKKFWIADDSDQYRFFDLNTGACEKFVYNSPFLHNSSEIAIVRDKVFVTNPGATGNLSPLGSFQGIYIYEKGQWQRFTGDTNPELRQGDCHKDLWRVAPHPTEEKFYLGSFTSGLIEAIGIGAPAKCFNKNNSILQDAGASGTARTAIAGMAFDKDNNLWICNYDANFPVAVRKPDGTFRNFTNPFANNLLQVAVDQNGYKWFVVGFNGGLLVYDSGSDLDNPADDRYKLFTTSNSVLPTNTVTCVAVDLEGDVWVGTQQGVVSFECGSNVFGNCRGTRKVVTVDDFGGYLLETEDIRSIAIDGANRKWFGTTNGIFVQSPDGREQAARFTVTNSPLFDNAITDLAINPKNGEVWIGTEKGLQSLRAEAVEGGRVNTRSPYAYPNPVQPGYDGPIAIYGLARDANIKITDVAGNLVFEGKALGGQAVWDGRDYLGRRAASGVYLIFATGTQNFEAPDAVVTKVVILN